MHNVKERPVVVTGAAGLIGSALIWALNRRGIDDIIAVDRLDESEKWRHLVPLRFADYVDADDLRRCVDDRPDAFGAIGTVFHLGACSSTTERDADYLMRNNYEYTKALAQWAVERDVRFVYASSAATYGATRRSMLSDEIDLRDAAAAQHVRVFEAALRSLRTAHAASATASLGSSISTSSAPTKTIRATCAASSVKAFEQIRAGGRRQALQELPSRVPRRRAAARFHLRQGCRRNDTCRRAKRRRRPGQRRLGSGADLARPRAADLRGARSARSGSNSSRCRNFCARNISILPRRESSALRACGYAAPITPLADAVSDYVVNYLVPGARPRPAQCTTPSPSDNEARCQIPVPNAAVKHVAAPRHRPNATR